MDKIKIYTRDYYLAIKKKKVLPFVTAWVDLEHIVLSEISQSEKDKHHMIPPVESNEQTTLASKVRTDSQKDSTMIAMGKHKGERTHEHGQKCSD